MTARGGAVKASIALGLLWRLPAGMAMTGWGFDFGRVSRWPARKRPYPDQRRQPAPRTRRAESASDLENGMAVRWTVSDAPGVIRRQGSRTRVIFDATGHGLDVSENGPVRPGDLEITGEGPASDADRPAGAR
jgi:hypothetical protein